MNVKGPEREPEGDRTRLAIHGGVPVRRGLLPYGHQLIKKSDVEAVIEVLRSDWLTTGPVVEDFERAFAEQVGTAHAVAVSSGTAALHASMHALGIGPGDEVIVPAMTFVATANCVLYCGARPVIVDVERGALLIDPVLVEKAITPRTRAVIAVDYAGHPCDYDLLREICDKYGIALVADACHALGGAYRGRPVGSLADLNTFSFHPVKHIATGEGGMVTTDDRQLADRMRVFRNHGISTDHRQRAERGSWIYEMVELGFNYRLSDIACALGRSQLRKIGKWIGKRRAIAEKYRDEFSGLCGVEPLAHAAHVRHAYHLFVVRFVAQTLTEQRGNVFSALRAEGIGVNVHYIPVHLHPFYQERLGTSLGQCPVAEQAYERILTLPIFPGMNREDIEDVIFAVRKVIGAFSK